MNTKNINLNDITIWINVLFQIV